jgi:hypothetical protein
MAMLEEKQWTEVLREFLVSTDRNTIRLAINALSDDSILPLQVEKSDKNVTAETFDFRELREPRDWFPLWSGFAPILSRELPFAVSHAPRHTKWQRLC